MNTLKITYLPIDEITLGKERQRKHYSNIKELASSIKKRGLIHPLIIEKESKRLIVGGRRLKALARLKWKEVPVIFKESLSPLEQELLELAENLQREDLTWQESAKAKERVLLLKKKMALKKGEQFTFKDAAKYLGESVGKIYGDVKLARAIKANPKLAKMKSRKAAVASMLSTEEKALVSELKKRSRLKRLSVDLEKVFLQGDALALSSSLKNESVDFILWDPPYGKGLEMKSSLFGSTSPYEDSWAEVAILLGGLIKESYRVLKNNTAMLIFCDILNFYNIKKMAEKEGFSVCTQPFLWCKSGGGGILVHDSLYGISVEYIIHCQKGRRPLNMKGKPNYLEVPRIPAIQKLHPTHKPPALLRYLLDQHSLPGELVVDFTAGSAQTLKEALRMGRHAWGCELSKEYFEKGMLNLSSLLKEALHKPMPFEGLSPGGGAWQQALTFNAKWPDVIEDMRKYEKERSSYIMSFE